VVFVTGLTDFESRANSMVSGGNDFIAKPFLFIELAVKALILVLRARLEPQPKRCS
jgi:DNA-binding response OmpR family regulator